MGTEAASTPMMEDDDHDKSLVFKRRVTDRDQSHRKPFDNKSDDGDSGDDRPLDSIMSRKLEFLRQVATRKPSLDRSRNTSKDESDDEAPLSSRFQKKHGNGILGSRLEDSADEKKPLVMKKL